MVNVLIRPMQPPDVAPCAAIISSTLLWQRYGVTPQSAVDTLSAALTGDGVLLVATLADDPDPDAARGFVWIAPRGAFGRSGYIRWIAVDETRRGTGIGLVLLTAAEAYVRQIATDIFLVCADYNVDAQRFYDRNGYTQVGIIPDYAVPGVAELIYRKRL